MIVDADLYDVYNLKQGVLRENLLVSGLDLNNCKEGQKIIVNKSLINIRKIFITYSFFLNMIV